jgi:N-acetyl-anhydromuramyl-L-alanine amidase AmpD
MMFSQEIVQTNNRSKGVNECLGVVLHHTGDYSLESIRNTFTNPEALASAHVVIGRDGRRLLFEHDGRGDDLILWHAGRSKWRGRTNCNRFTLGVEFQGDTNEKPLTSSQIQSFLQWWQPRAERYGWTHKDITDHRTVSPGRKVDIHPDQLARVIEKVIALETKA